MVLTPVSACRITDGTFGDAEYFQDLVDNVNDMTKSNDWFLVANDFASYMEAQKEVDQVSSNECPSQLVYALCIEGGSVCIQRTCCLGPQYIRAQCSRIRFGCFRRFLPYCRCMPTRMNGPEEVFCIQQAVASSHLTAPSMNMQRTSGMSSRCQCPAAKPTWPRAQDMHCAVKECDVSFAGVECCCQSVWGSFHVSDNK